MHVVLGRMGRAAREKGAHPEPGRSVVEAGTQHLSEVGVCCLLSLPVSGRSVVLPASSAAPQGFSPQSRLPSLGLGQKQNSSTDTRPSLLLLRCLEWKCCSSADGLAGCPMAWKRTHGAREAEEENQAGGVGASLPTSAQISFSSIQEGPWSQGHGAGCEWKGLPLSGVALWGQPC